METYFEWDDNKNRINLQKHGIDFETARFVFDDPNIVTRQDRVENYEQRWQSIGRISNVVIVLVAHTVRHHSDTEIIRIISARKANRKEKRYYESRAFR